MKKYKCPYCHKRFKSLTGLDRHLRKRHHTSLKRLRGDIYMERITIRLDPQVKNRLLNNARREGVSLSEYIRKIMKKVR